MGNSMWQRSSRALGALSCSLILSGCGAGDDAHVAPGSEEAPPADAGGSGRGSPPIDPKRPDRGEIDVEAGPGTPFPDAGPDAEPPAVCDDVEIGAMVAEGCGDGVFDPAVEECDDGNILDDDACDALCRVADMPMVGADVAPGGRRLGAGRHGIATGCGIAFAYVESMAGGSQRIGRTRLSRSGTLLDVLADVSAGAVPAAEPDPVIAELPDHSFAVAFTDDGGDGDGLGIVLRRASEDVASEALVRVNSKIAAAQRDPDMVWTGSELAIAWVDLSDAATAPDLRYRLFDSDLSPVGAEQALVDGPKAESAVALAAFGGSFAAAWRVASAGLEQIEVRAGETNWKVGPFVAGPAGERPALVALDDDRLLVAFTETLEPGVARLSAALLDVAAPGDALWFELAPEPGGEEPLHDQTQPSVLRAANRVFFAWHETSPPGSEFAEELWLKEVPLASVEGGGVVLDLDGAEMTLPRSSALRLGDQRFPALAAVSSAEGTSIAAAWVDLAWGLSAGTGRSTVIAELLPLPITRHVGDEGT